MKKFTILFLFFLALAISCEDQRVEPQKDKLSRVAYSSLAKEEKLADALKGINMVTNAGGRAMSILEAVDTDSILMVLQSDSLNYTYTLAIDQAITSGSFKDLVLQRRANGYLASVLEYKQTGGFSDFAQFTGTINQYNLDGGLMLSVALQNGRPVKKSSSGGRVQCVDIVMYREHPNGGDCSPIGTQWDNCELVIRIEDCGRGGESPWSPELPPTYIPDPGTSTGGGGSGGVSGGGSPGGGRDQMDEPIGRSRQSELEIQAMIEEIEDPEEKRRAQLDYLKSHGASEFALMVTDLVNTPEITVGEVFDINGMVNTVYLNQKAQFFIAVFNPETVGTILSLGFYSTNLRQPIRNSYFALVARYASTNVGRGFSSFEAFKREFGAAGEGMDWHHIVEQRAANLARYSAERIHNTNNLVKIERTVHQSQINAFYGSNRQVSGGISVREWLNTKSFEFQYEFGLDILHRVKNGLPLPL